jgi:hypothetical protein
MFGKKLWKQFQLGRLPMSYECRQWLNNEIALYIAVVKRPQMGFDDFIHFTSSEYTVLSSDKT